MVCCRAYHAFYLWLSQDDDTPLQATRKWLYPILLLCGALLTPSAMLCMYLAGGLYPQFAVWLSFATLSFLATFAWVCITRHVSDHMLTFTAASLVAYIYAIDWIGVSYSSSRHWPLIIVFTDVAHVLRAPMWLVRCVVGSAIVYSTVISFELQYRVGLLDVWGLPSQAQRSAILTGCESLPCGSASFLSATNDVISAGFVFLADFYFTSGFVRRIKGEVDVVEAAITTAQVIAANLVDFDLEAATANLDTARGRLPENLTNAFGDLIAHLEMYRPFLPDSLFEDAAAGASAPGLSGDMASAGYGGADVAIAFTDIRSSSTIWKANPEAMRLALRVHNKVIRRCIDTHDGYEVKTIGDAFMVAFWTVEDAVQFGLAVQEGLAAAHWPGELLQLPECLKVDGVWGGLAVRIGVAHGEATMERNDLTGRWDYFGTTVNLASRLEGVAVVGSVAGLGEQVTRALGGRVDERQVVYDGRAMLKGVSSGVGQEVLAIVPAGLTRRKWRPHCIVDDDGTDRTAVDAHDAVSTRRASLTSSMRECSSAPSSCGNAIPLRATQQSVVGMVHPLSQVKSATVGTVCVTLDDTIRRDGAGAAFFFSDLLQMMQSVLGRTSGTLVTVHGSMFSVSWGVVRRGAHFEEAVGFAFLMHDAAPKLAAQHVLHHSTACPLFTVGLCAGPLLAGSIGRGQQRFVTTLGRPVMGALRLGLLAQERGLPTLYGACSEAHSPATCGALEHNLVLISGASSEWDAVGERLTSMQCVYAVQPAAGGVESGNVAVYVATAAHDKRPSSSYLSPILSRGTLVRPASSAGMSVLGGRSPMTGSHVTESYTASDLMVEEVHPAR